MNNFKFLTARRLPPLLGLVCLLAPGTGINAAEDPAAASDAPVPAGEYTLDLSHTSLLFRVNHLGFSMYTARFTGISGELQFDPNNLEDASLRVTVDARSLETDFPTPEEVDFDQELQGEAWLNTSRFPEMTYVSNGIEQTGEDQITVTGDLTLRGVTRPVELTVNYNGGYAGHPMDPNARIGFSASGELMRSDFGVDYGIPEPGSDFGVSDRVEIIIETEFNGPPL